MIANNTTVPKLRFAEFSGKWTTKKIGELSDCIVPGRNKPSVFNGNIPWITTPDIEGFGLILKSRNGLCISKEEAKKVGSKIVPENAIIISCVGELGICGIAGTEIVINQQLHSFIPYPEISSRFLLYQVSLQKKYMETMATKTSVPYLNKDNCNSIPITFPSLPEQQKIASFLTAVDAKIDLLTKKKILLEQYKKSVMQQLFSQQIRFKDDNGNDFPNWEEKKFGEIYSFKSTNSYSRDKLNYEAGEVKNIHYGDVHTKFRTLFDATKEKVPYLNQDINVGKINIENYCKEGDIIFADASEDVNDVGKSIEIVNLNRQKIVSGLHTILARPKSGEMFIGFGGYLFKSDFVRTQIQKESQGSKVLSISTKRLLNIALLRPTISEQKKIVNFLTAVDMKLENIQKQLESTQAYKKCLLQQLFV